MEVHRIRVQSDKTLTLIVTDLPNLEVNMVRYKSNNYLRTQEIGDAVAFLECDGLIVPSARWNCDNLVLFTENHKLENDLELIETEQIDWREWAATNGFIDGEDTSP